MKKDALERITCYNKNIIEYKIENEEYKIQNEKDEKNNTVLKLKSEII